MDEIVILVIGAIIAIVLIVVLRSIAQRFTDKAREEAVAAFLAHRDEKPVLVHAYGKSALGVFLNEPRILLSEKGAGISPLATGAVTGWYVGEVIQSAAQGMTGASRATSHVHTDDDSSATRTRYVLIYAGTDQPQIQIGILNRDEEPAIIEALQAVMPDKQMDEPGHVRSIFDRRANNTDMGATQ
jgi:hypothetical protein